MHGKSEDEARYLLESAHAVADAGAFAVVLECVEAGLATRITAEISIPTIGIGAGTDTDGQILVTNDLVGLTAGRVPKFVSPTASLREPFRAAVDAYVARTLAPQSANPVPTSRPEGHDAARH
jgi:3-methyl-2-oxobutanoate hydroxymethyltransferase